MRKTRCSLLLMMLWKFQSMKVQLQQVGVRQKELSPSSPLTATWLVRVCINLPPVNHLYLLWRELHLVWWHHSKTAQSLQLIIVAKKISVWYILNLLLWKRLQQRPFARVRKSQCYKKLLFLRPSNLALFLLAWNLMLRLLVLKSHLLALL